jgi:solute:Na+ symporter, SSS family
MINFYGAIAAILVSWLVMLVVTAVTRPKPREELVGLVWGEPDPDSPDAQPAGTVAVRAWWERPSVLGVGALVVTAALSLIFV